MRPATALAFLLLLLPLPGAWAETGGNARDPIVQADAVNQVAMSGTTGHFLVAIDDPGSSLPNGPADDVPVWRLYDRAGGSLQAGTTDANPCFPARLQDMCTSDALVAAIRGDGGRFLVGGDVSQSVSDTSRAILVLGTPTQGAVARLSLTRPLVDVDMPRTGEHFAVAAKNLSATGDWTGTHVAVYEWDGTTAAPTLENELDLSTQLRCIDLADDGQSLVMASGSHHRWFWAGGTNTNPHSGATGSAISCALSDGVPNRFSIAGTDSGQVLVFSGKTGANFAAPVFSRSPTSADITAVAIDPAGLHAVAGDADGKLYLFELASDPFDNRQVASLDIADAAITHLQFGQRGAHQLLLATAGPKATLLEVTATGMATLWTHDAGAAIVSAAATADLESIVVAKATDVVVLDASHVLAGSLPAPLVGQPGQHVEGTLRIRNDGNRPENATLSISQPSGWTVRLDATSLELAYGAHADVPIEVDVPVGQLPGTTNVAVSYTLLGGGAGTIMVPVQVPEVSALEMVADGALSLGISPGTPQQFTFKVANRGNTPQTTGFDVDAPDGWDARVAPEEVSLSAGQERTVTLTVEAPAGLVEGDQGETLVALTADRAQALAFLATVGARFVVDLDAPRAVDVAPGGEALIHLVVKNRGNTEDGYDLSLADPVPAGWTIAFDNGGTDLNILGVGAGTETEVVLVVRAPADAVPESVLQVEVAAVSQGDPASRQRDRVLVNVVTPEDLTKTKDKDSPAPGLPAFLALLVAAAVVSAARWDAPRRR